MSAYTRRTLQRVVQRTTHIYSRFLFMFTLLFETVQVITKVNSQIMSVQLLLELFVVLKNIKDASPPPSKY